MTDALNRGTLDKPVILRDDIAREYHRQTCERCPLHVTRTTIVWGRGHQQNRIMVVGTIPERVDDEHGIPFVGPHGDILNAIWTTVGLPRHLMFLTMLNRCLPSFQRLPTPDEQHACQPYLWQEITEVRPNIVVALGSVPFERLLWYAQATPLGGPLYNARVGDAAFTLMQTPAPADYLRQAVGEGRDEMMQTMVDDWRMVARGWGASV